MEAGQIKPDTGIGSDEWRSVEQGAHEVDEAIVNAFEFSGLPDESEHGADKRARVLIGQALSAMNDLAMIANQVAEDLEVIARDESGG